VTISSNWAGELWPRNASPVRWARFNSHAADACRADTRGICRCTAWLSDSRYPRTAETRETFHRAFGHVPGDRRIPKLPNLQPHTALMQVFNEPFESRRVFCAIAAARPIPWVQGRSRVVQLLARASRRARITMMASASSDIRNMVSGRRLYSCRRAWRMETESGCVCEGLGARDFFYLPCLDSSVLKFFRSHDFALLIEFVEGCIRCECRACMRFMASLDRCGVAVML